MKAPALYVGNCLEVLATLEAEIFDAVVTDPPYELGFMGRAWDSSGVAFQVDTWKAIARVLKPGGYLLAFGGSRTYHRLAVAIEDAGLELRDSIDWIYGTGFPKSVDAEREVARFQCPRVGRHFLRHLPKGDKLRPGDHVCEATPESRSFEGLGSALKPSKEPIVVARKPFAGTIGANLLEHGTGGLRIDACRLGLNGERPPSGSGDRSTTPVFAQDAWSKGHQHAGNVTPDAGRWPPNVVLSHSVDCRPAGHVGAPLSELEAGRPLAYLCAPGCPVAELDQQSGHSETPEEVTQGAGNRGITLRGLQNEQTVPSYGDAGGASRFFPVFRYEAKAGGDERDLGCEDLPRRTGAEMTASSSDAARLNSPRTGAGRGKGARNWHPTVKPLDLVRWLCRLVGAPGQAVLDPFMGSGTTGMACALEGLEFTGVDLEADHIEIARRRIAAAADLIPAMLAIADGLEPFQEAPTVTQAGLFEAEG